MTTQTYKEPVLCLESQSPRVPGPRTEAPGLAGLTWAHLRGRDWTPCSALVTEESAVPGHPQGTPQLPWGSCTESHVLRRKVAD